MKIFLLIDWPKTNNKFWLVDELEKLDVKLIVLGIQNFNEKNTLIRWRKILLWLYYLKLSILVLRKSKKGDAIIAWNFVMGALTGFLNRLFRCKRKILALNMIVHKKHFMNSKLRNLIYNYVLLSDDFFITVNTVELVDMYRNLYNLNVKNYIQLSDVFEMPAEITVYDNGDGTIFAGGEAARDWKTLLGAASMIPDTKFTLIARRKYFHPDIPIPSNVEIQLDQNENTFYSIMKKSSLVVLPLSGLIPAGLIVLLHAAMYSKPVIATSTPSVRNYVIDKQTGVLVKMGDVQSLSEEISRLMKSPDLRHKYAIGLREHITQNFTPSKYAARIKDILQINQWI
jgi:glycosyltransferase involved in cell wall biosynthesis